MKNSGCLSELRLLQLDADEVTATSGADRAHVARCPACEQRLATIARERQADAAELAPSLAAMLAMAPAAAVLDLAAARARRIRRVAVAGVAVAAAAAVMLWQVRARDGAGITEDGVRTKGAGLRLDVHVRAPGQVAVLATADTALHPDDELRFAIAVSAVTTGHVAVFARDGAGAVNVYATSAGSLEATVPLSLGAEPAALPGAVALDATLGDEALWLVVCPQPIALREVRAQAQAAAPGWPVLPTGCQGLERRFAKVPR